jgi:putative glycosyltransferase (TIGR04372 family)
MRIQYRKFSLRYFYNVIHSIWAIPCVFIIRLIRPIVLIRVGTFFSARIGHFAMDAGMIWSEHQYHNYKVVDLYWIDEPVSNIQWKKMIERNLYVSPLFSHLGRWNRLIPGGDCHYRQHSDTASRDIYGILENSKEQFDFLPEEVDDSKLWLKKHGWKEGDKFVCLQVRDSAYLGSEEWHSQYNWDYHSYRNSDIDSYSLAINWLVEQGIWVLRMGKKVHKNIPVKHPKIIDYPFSPNKKDLLDIWLFANCDLCISTATGPDLISSVYRRPILLVNYLPLIDIYSWGNVLGYPKNLIWKISKKSLTLNEHLKYRFGHTDKYEESGIEVINLSPNEILNTVKECWGRLDGTYMVTENDVNNQEVFWKKLLSHENSKGYHCFIHKEARISATFLNNNKNFLN